MRGEGQRGWAMDRDKGKRTKKRREGQRKKKKT